ncbi:hypothetical protein T484DRAFT_1848563 [Baffinella frigidus]|nr:hypothetical protein T484DRAFT_1848563 [Cryptophyta sp. CCMP2293]
MALTLADRLAHAVSLLIVIAAFSGARAKDTCNTCEGYRGDNGTDCSPCDIGAFKDWVGEGECVPCEARSGRV